MFLGAANAEDQTLQDQIMGFKRLEFNNRYGGYVANLCTQLGVQPTKLTLGGFDLLAEPWITIKDEIGEETSRLECYASSPISKAALWEGSASNQDVRRHLSRLSRGRSGPESHLVFHTAICWTE